MVLSCEYCHTGRVKGIAVMPSLGDSLHFLCTLTRKTPRCFDARVSWYRIHPMLVLTVFSWIIYSEVPLNFQSLHDMVCCFVFTTEPLGHVKTKDLGVFLMRVHLFPFWYSNSSVWMTNRLHTLHYLTIHAGVRHNAHDFCQPICLAAFNHSF